MTSSTEPSLVRGLLWRPTDDDGIEVAAVRSGDSSSDHGAPDGPATWSLPAGPVGTDEHPLLAAVRVARERTGHAVVVGPLLGPGGDSWAMRALPLDDAPNDEPGAPRWLSPEQAGTELSGPDLTALDEFRDGPAATFPVLLLRHAVAQHPSDFDGEDRARPLTDLGRAQAEELTPLLDAYGVARIHAADVLRCLQTAQPFGKGHSLPVEPEPLLGEAGRAGDPAAALDRLIELASTTVPTAIISQDGAIPGLLTDLCDALGVEPPNLGPLAEASGVVLHFDDEGTELDLVAIDQLSVH